MQAHARVGTASMGGAVAVRFRHAAIAALTAGILAFSAQPHAADLTGTWTGTLVQGDESTEIGLDFSESGYLVLTYTDNRGLERSVELAEPGQEIRYVPPGGGVRTHVVESVAQQPGRLSYVLSHSFEGSNNGYLTQDYDREQIEFLLTPQGLSTRIASSSSAYFGDSTGSTGGTDTHVAAGVLQRAGPQPSTPLSDQTANEPDAMAGFEQEMAELSRQQEQLSRQLDAMHRQAMEAIGTIRSDP